MFSYFPQNILDKKIQPAGHFVPRQAGFFNNFIPNIKFTVLYVHQAD